MPQCRVGGGGFWRGLGRLGVQRTPRQSVRYEQQGTHSNSIFKSLVFPFQLEIFPTQIAVICNLFICKADLADTFSFEEKFGNFALDIAIFFRIMDFVSKFPVFSLTGIFFLPFSLFSLWNVVPGATCIEGHSPGGTSS